MIEFQDAMLEDPAWLDMAVARMKLGETAAAAWRAVLDNEAAAFESAGDPVFVARAADMRDLRDRVLAALHGDALDDPIPPGAIYVSSDIALSRFLGHDWTGGGVALHRGSELGHVAVLARQRGIPMLVGVTGHAPLAPDGTEVVLDATAGRLIMGPRRHAEFRSEVPAASPAMPVATTRNGTHVALHVSMARMEDVAGLSVAATAGIGLMRTEFSFNGRLAGEAEHLALYQSALAWAAGKPVTIRLMDWGGDKPLPQSGMAVETEGLRGVALLIRHPDLFRPQIRALLRAALAPSLQVLLPMVSAPEEVDAVQGIFAEQAALLTKAGIMHGMPRIGIMVEVPSVLLEPERFQRAAFFSIGTNDLVRGTGLGIEGVLAMLEPFLRGAEALGVPVNLCGDAASEPLLASALVAAGLRSLTVAPHALGAMAQAIATVGQGAVPATAAWQEVQA